MTIETKLISLVVVSLLVLTVIITISSVSEITSKIIKSTVFVINKGIVSPLKEFENGLLGFFKYINREQNDVQQLNSSSNDEIGDMSSVVNENIKKIKSFIEEDRRVIDNTIEVLSEFEQEGFAKGLT